MTTQAVSASVWGTGGGDTRGRAFSDTATDGVFDGNNLLSVIGGGELGQVLKGRPVQYVCVSYAAGTCAWKIMDRTTQAVRRYGFGVKSGQVSQDDCKIATYVIQESDILVVYPTAV